MLGIPEDHRAAFLVGSNVSGRILDPAPMTREELDQRQHQHTAMGNAYFDQLCDLRRREPQDDLTTELVRAEEAGDRLTAEELRGQHRPAVRRRPRDDHQPDRQRPAGAASRSPTSGSG